VRRTFLATYRLSAIVSVAVLTAGFMPANDAIADVPEPPSFIITGGGGEGLSTLDLVDAAKKTACTPNGETSDSDTWTGELHAIVNTSPLKPEIQYVWNTYDSDVQGSAMGWVPDTGCAKQIKLESQIIDTSAAGHCQPVVKSKLFTAYGHDHWTLDDGTNVLVGVNPNAFQLPVTYFGDDGSDDLVPASEVDQNLPASSSPDEVSPYCVRSTSVVSAKTTGYYLNNLDQYVRFACEEDHYRVSMTAGGPQIEYIETVPC